MKILIILLLIFVSESSYADWSPPSEPDPRSILNEARDDYRAGNYKDSLTKHIWFHDNALKYRRSLYGVRLSFALSDWHHLSTIYPPALVALKASRDNSEINIRNGVNARDYFNDFESINSKLHADEKTVNLFVWLDKNHTDRAKLVYDLAETLLISAKKYELCGRYIDPDNAFLRYVKNFHSFLKFAKARNLPAKRMSFAYNNYSNNVSNLVALLIRNKRHQLAEEIADMALLEWDDPNFKIQLEMALDGQFPPTWP
ncbi:MAG: hypothetical protein KAT25_06560 [Sulfuriflexus sp.]|nr:hypothetical protein [Sulfuriflexus sp.]